MQPSNGARTGEGIRVLIPTSRDVYRTVSYGMIVDFEDAIVAASDADLVPVPLFSRRAQLQGLLRGRPPRAVQPPRARYDVCVLVAMAPYWLPSLRYIRNLRSAAQRVVVYLFDSWLRDLPTLRSYRRLWSLVDDLIVSFAHSLDSYTRALPCRVHYLPQAIDGRWFHPYRGERRVDILSLGRRLEPVHAQLLEISRRRDLFYEYQTHRMPQAIDFAENQELVGRECQLARTHVSWSVDRTNPLRQGEGTAVTARWFESAATGGVVVGAAPGGDEFRRLFPYPEFVIELDPATPARTETLVMRAISQSPAPERLQLAEHVVANHTWSRRWQEIIELLKL
jgi:hypothetical protein